MKFLKISLKLASLIGLLCLLGLLIWYPWLARRIWGPAYDLFSGQEYILTVEDLESQLADIETIPYDSVMQLSYGPAQKLDISKHVRRYRNRDFFVIRGWERYRYLVGHHRIDAFLTPHRVRGRKLPAKGSEQIFYIDKKVLLRLLALHLEMREEGLDDSEISVTSAFRPPAYNEAVGGKPLSRHLSGDAIDILVGDVDRDGDTGEEDFMAVFNLLEYRIIGNRGGLGRYKSNRQLIHFDARGRRARWHY